MSLDGLQSAFLAIGEDIKEVVTEKPIAVAGIGVAALGTAGLIVAGVIRKRKKNSKKKTKRGRKRDRKFISKQKHEVRRRRKKPAKIYGKKGKYYSRKPLRKSKKRVGKTYYTKKGQPYKILASGKAKFIKKTKRRT